MNNEDCAVGYESGSFYFKGTSKAADPTCPIMTISWYGAVEYCNWKSEESGKEPG